MQLVLQGPLRPETGAIVRHYLRSELVERIVVSCWETCPPLDVRDARVVVLYNEPVELAGTNNVNCQLATSARGLALVTSERAAKLRSDQKLSLASLATMDEFARRFREPGPPEPIFVAGVYDSFPFHPRDHVFWGRTHDLRTLFAAPPTREPCVANPDFGRVLRPEAWLGAHYVARFDPRVAAFLREPLKFLVDGAPRRPEALAVDREVLGRYFKPFPRLDLEWPKYQLRAYHYAHAATLGERWHEAPWR